MKKALIQAKKAYIINEVPVGAVVVKNGNIISYGFNKKEHKKSPLEHAEIIAIEKASKKLNSWRLSDCDLYVTLEPCPMCAGAIIQARIKNVYFGAYDYKNGACGSVVDLFSYEKFNHSPYKFGGILEKECSFLLKSFFTNLRKKANL